MFGEAALILDKSAFQALWRDEHVERSAIYRENIPPVLLREILGDLAKTDVKRGPEQLVTTLARKFLGSGGAINANYRKLCLASLSGQIFPMDGRPLVDEFKEFLDSDGNLGVLIEPTQGNWDILQWAAAEFGARERWLAAEMRNRAHSFSLDALRGRLKQHRVLLPRPKNVADIAAVTDGILSMTSLKVPLVDWLVEQLGLPPATRQAASAGWGRMDVSLKDGAPYAFHCARVLLMLLIGMTHKLLSERPTNRLDAEYLFYVPFCSVFVSDDKLHRQLAPFILRADQRFASLSEFREELRHSRELRGNQEPPRPTEARS